MNLLISGKLQAKFAHRLRVAIRYLDPFRKVKMFSVHDYHDTIGRIYVINLDRKPKRWKTTRRELDRFRTGDNEPLTAITRRFSAVDARYLSAAPQPDVLIPTFTLAEQLAVHPDPLLTVDKKTRALVITMTRPEIAIALSHIEVWKLIANGDAEWTMVLEDDIMMRAGFATTMSRQWPVLMQTGAELIYLAYRDVSETIRIDSKAVHQQISPGLWEACAYVLSRGGARKLLNALPANGPIDLWMNFQFGDVRTFTTSTQVIEQRLAEPSTNSYSVLPVLSQVGAITREKVLVSKKKRLRGPVLAVGSKGTGMTSLAGALSMLGYTVASDLSTLPANELAYIKRLGYSKAFDAFVNIRVFDDLLLARLMKRRNAMLIVTDESKVPAGISMRRVLILPPATNDKWDKLSKFLRIDYPSFPYPDDPDIEQRRLETKINLSMNRHTDLKWDRSPWVIPSLRLKDGLALYSRVVPTIEIVRWCPGDSLRNDIWTMREDTFPSNLALFQPSNVKVNESINLTLKAEKTRVRNFTAAAVAVRAPLLYGSFSASLRPARGSGVITGLFLHRSGPRQEIDIEFLGKDTTKMLVNVFYNPGPEGTKLEYGYRGTPTEIILGFDAADAFHQYEIEWRPEVIKWKVDGVIVYRRTQWNPTPIPDRPLEFNINIWTSRSIEFAGHLGLETLPATTFTRNISIHD